MQMCGCHSRIKKKEADLRIRSAPLFVFRFFAAYLVVKAKMQWLL